MSNDGIELPAGISIEDPRPIAASAPYTFELPWPAELASLGPGDLAKAVFIGLGEDGMECAERMWIHVQRVQDLMVEGYLGNDPVDMPAIKHGDPVRVPLTHLIDCIFHEGKAPPNVPQRRTYWERCMVDPCVVDGRSHADYLYREEPDMTREGDEYPDSGWRIRGTDEAIAEDERLGEKPMYIALGKVLNADDRWLHLIDREIGCAFQWDADRDDYLELE